MRLVRRLLLRERPVARIGHRQRARDHQHLGKAAGVARREDHAPDARIDRQPRELASERRQRALRVDRGELLQQLVAVGDRPRRRRLEERKRVDRRQSQRRHAQDHRRERRAQDLGVGVWRPRGEVVLAIEAHADARGDAAAASGALVRCRLRDLFDLQQRRLVAQRIALDAREPGVDHVADARHRQRRLGDVGREHDPPAARRREDALLLGHGQSRVERQDLERRRIRAARKCLRRSSAGGLADLALAGKEHEDVAGSLAPQAPRPRRRSRPRARPRRRPPRRPWSAADTGPRPGRRGPKPR